jgi:two-component system osmolarity sensor histidine kinase EnvZ
LAVAADRFGRGQDVPKFKPEGANEVRQAARAFIDMRRRIQRQVSQRTDMLAGVSHDLRTPLTRLNLELEMLSETVNVEGMKQDVHEMERMVAGYIDFVRGDGEEQFEFIELKTLFDKMIAALNRQRVAVAQDVEEGLRVRVRPLAFERALNNLMVNASKYGEHVWVSAFLDDGKVHIQIEDDGPGIAEEMLSEVFKPFKRVDDSRNAETGGVGLGLSIAMDIVQSHGGNIELSTSTYGGLCAVVRLPV